ncbi:MAG: hypothetical protein ACI9HA_002485 [Dinoroseobacter sp.]
MSDKVEIIEQRLRLGVAARLKVDHLPRWVHGIGLGGTLTVLAVFVTLLLVSKDLPIWADWAPADEFKNPAYGERGYLAHAPIQSFLFGAALIYSGLGSGFFHASLTRYGQQCDVGAMYAMALCMATIPIGSWLPRVEAPGTSRPYPTWPFIAVFVVCGSLYFTYYEWDYIFSEVSTYSSAVLFIFATVSLFQPGKYLQIRWFIAAFVSILLAAQIRESRYAG